MPRFPGPIAAGPVRGGVVPIETATRISRAVGAVGDTVASIGLQMQAEENQRERHDIYTRATTDLQKRLTNIEIAAEDADDIDGIGAMVRDESQRAYEETLDTIGDENVRSEFENFALPRVTSSLIKGGQIMDKAKDNRALAELPGQVAAIKNAIAREDSPEGKAALRDELNAAIKLNRAMSRDPVAADNMIRRENEDLDQAALLGLHETDPEEALRLTATPEAFQGYSEWLGEKHRVIHHDRFKRIEKARIRRNQVEARRAQALAKKQDLVNVIRDSEADMEGTLAILEDADLAREKYPGFDDMDVIIQRDALRNRVQSTNYAEKGLEISRASSMYELNNLDADIEDDMEASRLSASQKTNLLQSADRQRATIQKNTADASFARSAYNGDILVSEATPGASDAADWLHGRILSTATDPEELSDDEIELVARIPVLPSTMKHRYMAAVTNFDVAAIEKEATQFAALNPAVKDQVPAKARIMFEAVEAGRMVGVPTSETVAQTEKSISMNATQRSSYEGIFNDFTREESPLEYLTSQMNAVVDPGVTGAFVNRARGWYMNDPMAGPEISYERAFRDMQNIYGTTDVGERPRGLEGAAVLYPIEKTAPEFGGDSDAITNQIQREVVSDFGGIPDSLIAQFARHGVNVSVGDLASGNLPIVVTHDAMTPFETGRKYVLDPETGDMILSEERGKTPGYPLWIQPADPEVAPVPLVDSNGDQFRYYPNWLESEAGMDFQRNQKAQLQSIREANEYMAELGGQFTEEVIPRGLRELNMQ